MHDMWHQFKSQEFRTKRDINYLQKLTKEVFITLRFYDLGLKGRFFSSSLKIAFKAFVFYLKAGAVIVMGRTFGVL